MFKTDGSPLPGQDELFVDAGKASTLHGAAVVVNCKKKARLVNFYGISVLQTGQGAQGCSKAVIHRIYQR